MNDSKASLLGYALLALAGLLLASSDVMAQDQTQQRYQGIIEAFALQSTVWQGALLQGARYLFFSLALIQLTWVNMELILRGGDFGDFANHNTKQIVLIGVMWMFLENSYDWMLAFVQGFRRAGEIAVLASAPGADSTGTGLDPANVLQNGLVIAGALFDKLSLLDGPLGIAIVLSALLMLFAFAYIAGLIGLALIESYVVIGAGVLLMGFGGSSWTSDIAKRTLMYAISTGAKLFVMQLIVGVALGTVVAWSTSVRTNWLGQVQIADVSSLVGLVIVIAMLTKSIPDLVQSFLSGSSLGNGAAAISTAAALGAAAVAGAKAVATGGATVAGALASGGANSALAGTTGAGALAGSAGGSTAGGGLSASMFHLARMGGHLTDAVSGHDLGRSMGAAMGAPALPKPSAPMLGAGGPGGGVPQSESSMQGEGGVIRGEGESASLDDAAGPSPTSTMGEVVGQPAAASPEGAAPSQGAAVGRKVGAAVGFYALGVVGGGVGAVVGGRAGAAIAGTAAGITAGVQRGLHQVSAGIEKAAAQHQPALKNRARGALDRAKSRFGLNQDESNDE